LQFQIKDHGGKILFCFEAVSLKLCVEAAVISSANLCDANLQYADLGGANLQGANLRGAGLQGANLQYADLQGTDLQNASLYGANLQYTNLQGADLQGADLQYTNLLGADLRDAKINKELVTPLRILLDQPGKIRAYKLVNEKDEGPFNGGIKYRLGESYNVKNADTNEYQQCGAGINLATLGWCVNNWQKGYKILVAEFTAKDIATIPIATDGKFRVKKCKIIREKNLKDVGLKKV